MRAIWKGAVSFGLVSIGVRLFSATEEKDIRFHQVHRSDGGRIKYKRVCSSCGEEVSYDDIAKGFDLGGGELVILTDEDFADLPLSTSRSIDVLEFVPSEQVDPILYHKAYYLEPDGIATKPYVLLRDALIESDRVAIVKMALRQREQLATLRVREGVLVLNTMLWPDEVRDTSFDFLDEDVTVRPQELAMATSLIESMAGDFKPEEYSDNYREALQAVIDAKVTGEPVVAPPELDVVPSAAVDLMAALRASVERAKAAREAAGAGGVGAAAASVEYEPVAPTPITSAKTSRATKAATTGASTEAGSTEASSTGAAKSASKSTAKRSGTKSASKSAPAKSASAKSAGSKSSAASTAGEAGGAAAPKKATKRTAAATSTPATKARRSA